MLHDAFLAGGAFVHVPAGVVVEKPIVVLHWSDGDGLASFPHTLVVAEEQSEVTVLDRFGSPDVDHLVDGVVELVVGDDAHVKYLSVQEHGPRTWSIVLQRAHVGRDATLRSSAVALGGDYARLRSESLLTGRGRRERPARGVLRRPGARCSTSARSRTTPRPAPAATCCSRVRSRTTRGRSTAG